MVIADSDNFAIGVGDGRRPMEGIKATVAHGVGAGVYGAGVAGEPPPAPSRSSSCVEPRRAAAGVPPRRPVRSLPFHSCQHHIRFSQQLLYPGSC